MKKEVLYHYGITRADLPPEVQTVQLYHAAGESSPGRVPKDTHAAILHVKDEAELRQLGWELAKAGFTPTLIVENDAPYTGQLMAIGLAPTFKTRPLKQVLSRLPRLRFGEKK